MEVLCSLMRAWQLIKHSYQLVHLLKHLLKSEIIEWKIVLLLKIPYFFSSPNMQLSSVFISMRSFYIRVYIAKGSYARA